MDLVAIFIVFSFLIYGFTSLVVYFRGPFGIFEIIRNTAAKISDGLGELFNCPVCSGTWLSFLISSLNLIFIPSLAFTPFNLILGGTGLWWLIILLDGIIGSGASWFIFKLEDYMVSNTKEDNEENDDVIKVQS